MSNQNIKPYIIGITGAFGSGKSTAAQFFQENGFQRVTLSSFLEEEALRRNVSSITRRVLQDIGNEWRKNYGRNILAKKALESIQASGAQVAVVDGIRNVGEIELLREHAQFILIAIMCDRERRFDRLKHLKRREDLTWELFTKLDYRDLGIGQRQTGLRVASCIALADVFIENNSTEEEFLERLKTFLRKK